MSLIIILNKSNPDAIQATRIIELAMTANGRADCRRHGEPFDAVGRAVIFVGAPSPHVLFMTMSKARAVAVLARHQPDLLPSGLMWSCGETLTDAADKGTAYLRPNPAA